MIEITEELVESVDAREILIQVTQVVLAELVGLVALRLQYSSERHGLIRQSHVCPSLTDGGQTRADWQLTGDEISAAGSTASLCIVIGEAHSLRCQLVEIRRFSRHYALVVGADVEPTNIIAHDDENVRFLILRRGGRRKSQPAYHEKRCKNNVYFAYHDSSPFPFSRIETHCTPTSKITAKKLRNRGDTTNYEIGCLLSKITGDGAGL